MATITLYGKMSKTLKDLGFEKSESENNKAVFRTWWNWPHQARIRTEAFAEILRSYDLYVEVVGNGCLRGHGWGLDEGTDPTDYYWTLNIYKDNPYGKLEARGTDTIDLMA